MNTIKNLIYILFLFANVVNIFSQDISYESDSIRVEALTSGYETYYTNTELYKKNFPRAIEIIENKLLPKRKSHYFQVRKAAIKDRQSVLLKTEEKYDEALTLLIENISYKEQIKDFETLSYTYRLIASIFVWQENYAKAQHYYTIGLQLAQKHANEKEEIEALLSLSRLYAIMEDLVKAEQKTSSALKKLETFNYPIGLSRAYDSYATIKRQQKQFEESIYYSKKNIETLAKNKDSLSLGFAYFNLGITYLDFKKFYPAIESLKKSIEFEGDSVSSGRIKSRYLILSDSYAGIGDYRNGYHYAVKYREANEKEGKIKTYKNTLDLEAKFKYERQRLVDSLQLVQNKKKIEFAVKRKANNRFWMVVSSLLLLVIMLWGLYYNRKQKIVTTELKNQLLHAEIASKKKDLSEFALTLSHDKEWTKNLYKQFEKYKYAKQDEKNMEIEILEKELLDKLNYDDITKEFNKRLENLSNTFYDNLKKHFPSLTKNDIKLCTFIKLKIDTPEIAKLQNISVASVNSSRYRLRKKLDLSPIQNLDDFIDSFI